MDAPDGEFARLLALHESGLVDSPPPPEFAPICHRVRERFGVDSALITLIDRDLQIVKAQEGSELEWTPRSDAFCNYTIRTDEVFVVPDTLADSRFSRNPLVTGKPFVRFYAGAPLIYMRQIRLGALCVLDHRPREFSLGERAELALFADEVVAIIARRDFPPSSELVAP